MGCSHDYDYIMIMIMTIIMQTKVASSHQKKFRGTM